jgi:outer membrane biogenesis lipoprotein LolB
MAIHKGAVMNNMKKLAVALLAVAGLSGCASTQIADLARNDAAQAVEQQPQVSRPTQSYGSMGGYRYRRFAAVAPSAS